MSPKEKSKELIKKFIPRMYCYLGSGMLTDSYDEEVALLNAIHCSIYCVEEIIKCKPSEPLNYNSSFLYWEEVIKELEETKKWI